MPKITQVISDPAGTRSEPKPEYLGDVVKFPAEMESVNYGVERTFAGIGAAIAKALNGQQSDDPPSWGPMNSTSPLLRARSK